MSNGWIEWSGGECPVGEGVIVEVKFRHGGGSYSERTAFGSQLRWRNEGLRNDIVAYRVVDLASPMGCGTSPRGDIQLTLRERRKTHGDFAKQGACAQELKAIVRSAEGWGQLTGWQQEALEMICHKISRILHARGEPDGQLVDETMRIALAAIAKAEGR